MLFRLKGLHGCARLCTWAWPYLVAGPVGDVRATADPTAEVTWASARGPGRGHPRRGPPAPDQAAGPPLSSARTPPRTPSSCRWRISRPRRRRSSWPARTRKTSATPRPERAPGTARNPGAAHPGREDPPPVAPLPRRRPGPRLAPFPFRARPPFPRRRRRPRPRWHPCWPAAARARTPAVLGQGTAHDRAALGAAPPAPALARTGPVAGAHPGRPGCRGARRGRDQHRADQQPGPGPGPARPRRHPGRHRAGAGSRGHPGGRGGQDGCGPLDRQAGVRGRHRVLRPADVRAAAGSGDPGRAAARARRQQSRPARQRPGRFHRRRAQRVRCPAEQRLRAGRASRLRDGRGTDRGPGRGGRRGRGLPAQPPGRRGGAGLRRPPAAASIPGSIPPPRPAGPWPPARSIPVC